MEIDNPNQQQPAQQPVANQQRSNLPMKNNSLWNRADYLILLGAILIIVSGVYYFVCSRIQLNASRYCDNPSLVLFLSGSTIGLISYLWRMQGERIRIISMIIGGILIIGGIGSMRDAYEHGLYGILLSSFLLSIGTLLTLPNYQANSGAKTHYKINFIGMLLISIFVPFFSFKACLLDVPRRPFCLEHSAAFSGFLWLLIFPIFFYRILQTGGSGKKDPSHKSPITKSSSSNTL